MNSKIRVEADEISTFGWGFHWSVDLNERGQCYLRQASVRSKSTSNRTTLKVSGRVDSGALTLDDVNSDSGQNKIITTQSRTTVISCLLNEHYNRYFVYTPTTRHGSVYVDDKIMCLNLEHSFIRQHPKQTDKQTDRWTGKQTDIQTDKHWHVTPERKMSGAANEGKFLAHAHSDRPPLSVEVIPLDSVTWSLLGWSRVVY